MNTIHPPQSDRFRESQINRTLKHSMLLQPTEEEEAKHELILASQRDSTDFIAEHFTTILCAPCKPPTSDPPGLSLEDENIAENEAWLKSEMECQSNRHTFVVLADSQLGMTSLNVEWETELHYCRMAIDRINALQPRPRRFFPCPNSTDKRQWNSSSNIG
jgi:hypothetical protein